MEAKSLASLNLLASNPPQYPVNPVDEAQEPLTLYISRVPGTRDVILSPFKPQLKNVTNEDVASSLYYIHLEMRRPSADLAMPQPIRDDGFRSSSEDSASAKVIPRKPLPRNARPITPESPPRTAINLQPPGQALPPQPPRPTHDSGVGLADSQPPPAEPFSVYAPEAYVEPMPARKPVGPRPMSSLYAPPPEKALPSLPRERLPPDETLRPRGHTLGAADRNSRSPSPRMLGTSSPNTAPFTLTLIRRDPSSGNQWNVGRISSQQLEPPPTSYDDVLNSPPSASSTVSRPPIDITIETSGYAKFRNMPVRQSGDLNRGRPRAISNLSRNGDETTQHRSEGMFSRQVVMSYSKSWTSTLKEKWAKKSHNRNTSKASIDSVGSNHSETAAEGMKPRGYVFTSPWDGRCEFRTGNGGRSVRCHHLLHEAASFNPLVDQESNAPKPASTVVSELRFNLPSSEVFAPGEQDRDLKSQWRGHFGKLMGHSGDDDDDAVSPFDINVGAEKAGGGNRGTRAKLGKLIIYNDGLKMLDLVVAANVGVWWGAWERNF